MKGRPAWRRWIICLPIATWSRKEAERYYRERVLRMPDGYLCYDPPAAAPPVGPPPSLENGYATFGSFNNLAKITPEVVAVWAEILRRVPAARLILKYRGLGDQTVKRRYLDLFAAQGVEPQRLELLPCEFVCGVSGDVSPGGRGAGPLSLFRQRHDLRGVMDGRAGDHLSRRDLCQPAFAQPPVQRGSDGDDRPRLATSTWSWLFLWQATCRDWPALRAGLRERMAASPLCDGKRFATNLASLLRDVWENG